MANKLDRVAELRTQLGPSLAAGETLTVARTVRRSLGSDEAAEAERESRIHDLVERAAGPPQPNRRRNWFERAAGAVASLAMNTSPVDLPTPELSDPNGRALVGAVGSQAVVLRDLMDQHSCVLANTPQRWFVLRDDARATDRSRALAEGSPLPYTVLAELLREQVRLRSAPTVLERGRLEMYFTDGSMLAVSALTRENAEVLAAS